ncbi:hypothetical protein DITRI_Ditri13aG0167000 [Diplodiscus trichospermus]
MQASTYPIKGNLGSEFSKRGLLPSFGEVRERNLPLNRNLCISSDSIHSGVSCGAVSMGAELSRARNGIQTVVRSSIKSRSVKAQASGGEVEDLIPINPQRKSSGTVLPFVGVACLGAILFGYHLGVVNGALEYLAKDLGIAENTVLQGMMGCQHTPCWCNCWFIYWGSTGRQVWPDKDFPIRCYPTYHWSSSYNASNFSATAQTVQTMIIGRLLAGIGIGISSAIVPLYISEISPTEIRGALGSVNQLFICIGILAALVAGLPLAGNPLWWRTMFGIAAVPSILLALGMAFSPESPRWLFQQGKIPEAEKSVRTLYGKERVAEVMYELRTAGQGSPEQEAGWFDLFSSRYSKVVSVGAALFLFQQLAGINAVVYYSTAVFRSAGIASDVAASALVGASNVFG